MKEEENYLLQLTVKRSELSLALAKHSNVFELISQSLPVFKAKMFIFTGIFAAAINNCTSFLFSHPSGKLMQDVVVHRSHAVTVKTLWLWLLAISKENLLINLLFIYFFNP